MPDTVDDLRKAQEEEYGTYVAKEPIVIDGALAFAVGHPVPKSHVDRKVVEESQVAKVGTKAAKSATEES